MGTTHPPGVGTTPYAPFVRAVPLAGRQLRHAGLAVLHAAGRPLAVGEVRDRIESAGFGIDGRPAHKVLADALGYEVRLGRLRRVGRGRYAVGHLPKVTASGCAADGATRSTPSTTSGADPSAR